MVNSFSQKDVLNGSLKCPVSLNNYRYCINNPIGYIDPLGQDYINIHDKGYFHRFVQEDIVNNIKDDVTYKNSNIMATEVQVIKADGTKGRIDLL